MEAKELGKGTWSLFRFNKNLLTNILILLVSLLDIVGSYAMG
jgi:hypothetical protein